MPDLSPLANVILIMVGSIIVVASWTFYTAVITPLREPEPLPPSASLYTQEQQELTTALEDLEAYNFGGERETVGTDNPFQGF